MIRNPKNINILLYKLSQELIDAKTNKRTVTVDNNIITCLVNNIFKINLDKKDHKIFNLNISVLTNCALHSIENKNVILQYTSEFSLYFKNNLHHFKDINVKLITAFISTLMSNMNAYEIVIKYVPFLNSIANYPRYKHNIDILHHTTLAIYHITNFNTENNSNLQLLIDFPNIIQYLMEVYFCKDELIQYYSIKSLAGLVSGTEEQSYQLLSQYPVILDIFIRTLTTDSKKMIACLFWGFSNIPFHRIQYNIDTPLYIIREYIILFFGTANSIKNDNSTLLLKTNMVSLISNIMIHGTSFHKKQFIHQDIITIFIYFILDFFTYNKTDDVIFDYFIDGFEAIVDEYKHMIKHANGIECLSIILNSENKHLQSRIYDIINVLQK